MTREKDPLFCRIGWHTRKVSRLNESRAGLYWSTYCLWCKTDLGKVPYVKDGRK